MKASDFTTGGNDREKAMSNLLKTEKTDAVNTVWWKRQIRAPKP